MVYLQRKEFLDEDLKKRSDGLLKSNPLGKVPTLILDSEEIISNSSLISDYLNDLKSEPFLWPKDKKTKHKLQNLDLMGKGLADVTVTMFHEKLLHPDNFHEGFLKRQEETVNRTLKFWDIHIKDLKDFSMASISIVCAIGYTEFRLKHLWPNKELKNLLAWYKDVTKRPSVIKTAPVE